MTATDAVHDQLRDFFAEHSDVLFAVLVGSRANGSAQNNSDWDIAIALNFQLDPTQCYEVLSDLQISLADKIKISPEKIDLIDLQRAGLAMREQVANQGVLLKGNNTLAWSRFLVRTWRELEMLAWEQDLYHAA